MGRSALALKMHPRRRTPTSCPPGVLALGLLALAVAADFLYLRVQVGIVQDRLEAVRRRRS